MTITIPTLEQMRDQYLDDVQLAAVDAGISDPPVGYGSDFYVRGTALANLMSIPLGGIAQAEVAWDPATCSDADVERWRATLGLPEITAQGARGKCLVRLDAASGTVVDGTALSYSGRLYRVVGTWTAVTDRTPVAVEAYPDTGEATNLAAGTQLTWVSPPPGFKSWVEVSSAEPLVDGVDAETPERKRERVLARLQTPALSANWQTVVEVIESAVPTVRVYVYPALGGPSGTLVVLAKQFAPGQRDFSRVATSGQLTRARQALWTQVPSCAKYVVVSASEETLNCALELELPDTNGWLDLAPWPQLEVADSGRVSVSSVTSSRVFTVSATTTTAPQNGVSHISWWSPGDQAFHTTTILSYTGSTGAWVLTVADPMVDEDGTLIATGDYISPSAIKMAEYGDTWRGILEAMGPGEDTTDPYRIPRASRKPLVSSTANPTLGVAQRKSLMGEHPEIVGVEYGYRSVTTPTVPGTSDQAPNVLTLDNFGLYLP